MQPWVFDQQVPERGYAWWYVDALSDDGRHGITVIAFLGTVFSPWYAWARRGGHGDPLNHCSIHVALYGRPGGWAMTDHRRDAVQRSPGRLVVGASSIEWDGTALAIRIEDRGAPLPRRIAGTVRIEPGAVSHREFILDAAGRHVWRPIAARARARVAFEQPGLDWAGPAYCDHNRGAAPLEQDFQSWDWCRAPGPDATAILYDARRRDGSRQALALRVGADGVVEDATLPPEAALPAGFWGVARPTRSEDGQARLIRSLVDAPFYTRSEIRTRLLGRDAAAVHESLDCDRFALLGVQAMLTLKVPRWRSR